MNEAEEKKLTFRNSYQRRSIKIGALKKFAKFTGKYLCQNPFFNEVVLLIENEHIFNCNKSRGVNRAVSSI